MHIFVCEICLMINDLLSVRNKVCLPHSLVSIHVDILVHLGVMSLSAHCGNSITSGGME